MPPPAKDKWEQFAEPTDKWEQYAESTEASQVASRPTKQAVFDIPRSSSEMIGEGAETEAAGREKMAREHPGALTSVALAGLPLPTKGIAGLATNVATRGAGALTGATYGGRMAAEAGLPKWPGQVIGGVAGLFAPEVIGKMSGPLISKIAAVLGKSTPEVAAEIAADSTLAQKVGRDVVERAARGAPLTPKEEEMLLEQVQKHYTPEAGVEASAQKAGKIYAGRGSSLRPTNEQLGISRARGGVAEMTPPPEPEGSAAPAAPAPIRGGGLPKGFVDVTQGSHEFSGEPIQPTNPAEGTAPSKAQLEWESNRSLASGKRPEAFTRAEEIAKRQGAAIDTERAVKEAGGVYLRKGASGHEMKLPLSMTKDLPIPEWQKPHISITIPSDKISTAQVRALIEAKLADFRK